MHKILVEECAFKLQSVRVLKDWTIQPLVCLCYTCDHTGLKFHGFVLDLCNANMVCFLHELNIIYMDFRLQRVKVSVIIVSGYSGKGLTELKKFIHPVEYTTGHST
jgi:hypothetical protein